MHRQDECRIRVPMSSNISVLIFEVDVLISSVLTRQFFLLNYKPLNNVLCGALSSEFDIAFYSRLTLHMKLM